MSDHSTQDPNRTRFNELRVLLDSFDAIYKELSLVAHVRVSRISGDDWGARMEIADLCSAGMPRLQRTPSSISSCWEVLDYEQHRFCSRYPGVWRLYFEPGIIQEVRVIFANAEPAQNPEYTCAFANQALALYDRKKMDQKISALRRV
jgi:hypothetical protein